MVDTDEKFLVKPFSNKGGILYIYDVNLFELAKERGTPILVTSEERLEQNYYSIFNSFSKLYKKFRINYAVKANSNPSILSVFRKLGSGADVASLGELFLARFSGFEREKISMTPNFASKDDLEYASRSGISINFDDIAQFEQLDVLPDIASFRVNPGIGGGEFPGIITGGHGSKFGIPEEYAIKAYRKAKDMGIKRFGIHMHGGSNNLSVDYFRTITKKFFSIAADIKRELGINFEFMDIGGGFGVPYRPGETPLDMEKVAQYIIENLDQYYLKSGEEPLLIVEPGRYLVADTTVLLGSVTTIKNYDKKIVGTDIGMNILLRPALYNAYHHITIANKLNKEKSSRVNIVGQICENTDKIAEDREFSEVEPGDIICVFNAGAYVYSMSSNYNGFLRPEELLVSKDSKVHIIRERENFTDLIKNVKIPQHLLF